MKIQRRYCNKAKIRKLHGWMREHEVSQVMIADEAGVTRQMVSAVINGKGTSRRVTDVMRKYVPSHLLEVYKRTWKRNEVKHAEIL